MPIPEKQDGILLPIIRYALIACGANYVQQGVITSEQLDVIVGAVIALTTTAWMIYNKKIRKV